MDQKNVSIQIPLQDRNQSYNSTTCLNVIQHLVKMLQVIRIISERLKMPQGKINEQSNRIVLRKFSDKLKQYNYEFITNHEKLHRLIKLIAKIKNEEINQKFKAQEFLWNKSGNDLNKHLYVVKQMYVKVFRAKNYQNYNETKINQIQIQHQLFIENSKRHFNLPALESSETQFKETKKNNDNLRVRLQEEFMSKNRAKKENSFTQIQRLAEIVNRKQIFNHKIIGFWTGIMLFILSLIIFIIVYNDITFKSQPQFKKTFPIWRGLSYFVFLIWIFAIQSYIFEYFGISFRLITTMNNYYIPKYPGLIMCAAFFTSFHMIMFFFYVIALVEFGIKFPDNFQLHYLPAASWIVMILFFTFPCHIFHYRKRLYPIAMLLRSFASPILGAQVKYHWWTQVWVSFRQPFRDLAFTFNYYFIDSNIVYEKTIIYETIAGVFLYSMRIIQNTRQMKQNNFCGRMPYYGSIKCFFNICTMITSYFCRVRLQQQIPTLALVAWICSAIISTSYAYWFDLKYDWGLLQTSPQSRYLRKQLIYGKKRLYYSIIICNLLFRFIWVLNISPDILRRIPVERHFLILIISFLQITRRGIWSTLRMQKQHIMYERYYNSIGIAANKETERTQVENGDLLVEIQDLNQTFKVQNKKIMGQIIDECEHQITSPKKKKKSMELQLTEQEYKQKEQSFQEESEEIMNLRKPKLLQKLTLQIESVNENMETLLESQVQFLRALEIKQLSYIESQRAF